ncbi:hypothetical protein [Desulfosediminicola sp.]|uniref:hypothetical protein n=1 Tax=Desulfosediminicola sp. TaxID=2886825 RepID=UPI003AF2134E
MTNPDTDPLRFRQRTFIGCALALLFTIGACTSQVQDIQFETRSLHSLPAQIEMESTASDVIFEVFSKSGIGRASITKAYGSWPAKTIIRLRLNNLEGFTFTAADRIFQIDELEIRSGIDQNGKYFDVCLARETFSDANSIFFSWVDYYR